MQLIQVVQGPEACDGRVAEAAFGGRLYRAVGAPKHSGPHWQVLAEPELKGMMQDGTVGQFDPLASRV